MVWNTQGAWTAKNCTSPFVVFHFNNLSSINLKLFGLKFHNVTLWTLLDNLLSWFILIYPLYFRLDFALFRNNFSFLKDTHLNSNTATDLSTILQLPPYFSPRCRLRRRSWRSYSTNYKTPNRKSKIYKLVALVIHIHVLLFIFTIRRNQFDHDENLSSGIWLVTSVFNWNMFSIVTV